ncbi:hypothetical protein BDV93DRAFT_515127 [Ceratobasidium sp. AG-I]|nr:hypothetical protein BDV93DRAFT_515127 [Ceratobasidium sp. AG-I]
MRALRDALAGCPHQNPVLAPAPAACMRVFAGICARKCEHSRMRVARATALPHGDLTMTPPHSPNLDHIYGRNGELILQTSVPLEYSLDGGFAAAQLFNPPTASSVNDHLEHSGTLCPTIQVRLCSQLGQVLRALVLQKCHVWFAHCRGTSNHNLRRPHPSPVRARHKHCPDKRMRRIGLISTTNLILKVNLSMLTPNSRAVADL